MQESENCYTDMCPARYHEFRVGAVGTGVAIGDDDGGGGLSSSSLAPTTRC